MEPNQTKPNQTQTPIYRKQLGGCQWGKEGIWRMSEMGKGGQEIQTSSYTISPGDVIYSIGNIVSNTVLSLYGDRW